MLLGMTRFCLVVTRRCQVRPGIVFWHSKNDKKSVLAQLEWQEKIFGVSEIASNAFWRIGSGKKSVLGMPRQDQYVGRL